MDRRLPEIHLLHQTKFPNIAIEYINPNSPIKIAILKR